MMAPRFLLILDTCIRFHQGYIVYELKDLIIECYRKFTCLRVVYNLLLADSVARTKRNLSSNVHNRNELPPA